MNTLVIQGFGSSTSVLNGFGTVVPSPGATISSFDMDLCNYLAGELSTTVYPGHIPQLVSLPAYSFWQLSEDPYYLLGGPSAGLGAVVYQIDCWASDYLTAIGLRDSLKNALQGFRGLMGSTMVSSRLANTHYQAESPANGSDYWTHHVACEYRFLRSEPVPTF